MSTATVRNGVAAHGSIPAPVVTPRFTGSKKGEFFKHLKRLGVILLNVLFGNRPVLAFVGLVNKYVVPGFLRSIFVLYPANPKYTREYVYGWYARSMKWRPRLVGVMFQNGRLGLTFGISASQEEIERDGEENLKVLVDRLESARRLVGAEQKSFAGILPSVLYKRGILDNPVERPTTAVAVCQAIAKVRRIEKLSGETPIVVLGGDGFIGREVVKRLQAEGMAEVFSVDLHNGNSFAGVSGRLYGRPTILLNVSRSGALGKISAGFWRGLVVLNEVYPEPTPRELQKIAASGAVFYHVVGIKAWAWPPFPRAYRGGIPCCASFLVKPGEGEYEVLVEKL